MLKLLTDKKRFGICNDIAS